MNNLLCFLVPLLLGIRQDVALPGKGAEGPAPAEANSSFEYFKEDNCLMINFFEQEMAQTQPEVIAQMKQRNSYLFEAPFTLPEELWKALGSEKPLTINKGCYPITFHDGVYSVHIRF